MNQKSEIRIPWGQGIVGFVGKSGTSLNIEDCYEDARFNQEIDAMTGYKTRSMMCHPIKVISTFMLCSWMLKLFGNYSKNIESFIPVLLTTN